MNYGTLIFYYILNLCLFIIRCTGEAVKPLRFSESSKMMAQLLYLIQLCLDIQSGRPFQSRFCQTF